MISGLLNGGLTSALNYQNLTDKVNQTMENTQSISKTIGEILNNINGTTQSQEWQSAEAEKTREWQEHMRDTDVSSQVSQYLENGLNTVLAANGLHSQTPSGAMAAAASGAGGLLNGISSIVNSAAGLSRVGVNKAEKEYMNALTKTMLSSAAKIVIKGFGL